MNLPKSHVASVFLAALASLLAAPIAAADGGPPPIPAAPVLLLGHPDLSGEALGDHTTEMTMGAAAKTGPLAFGEKVEARATQRTTMERVSVDGDRILRRTTEIRPAGSEDVVARASIDMDPRSLRPLRAQTEQGGNTTTLEYDWDDFVVRKTTSNGDGQESVETPLDMPMVEVGAHDVWMAALPLRKGFTARLPAVFGATGTKYWAVPRVVGSEAIDLGDGQRHAAWVVELDWWGMGAANTADNHSKGGGANDTAGAGGKYWVLEKPVPGQPRVVRVRTEVNPTTDSVIQVQ